MDLIKLSIPAPFIMARAHLSWRELKFGLSNELLVSQAVVDFAVEQVTRLECPSPALLDLAGSSRSDAIRELVEQLAAGEPEPVENEPLEKWLYLTLAWLYEKRAALPDPLQTVEEVYADFGYPEAIAGFVRYMPMDGPDLGSREANETRLMDRWKEYLDSMSARYMP